MRSVDNVDNDDPISQLILEIVLGIFITVFTPVFLWFAEIQIVHYETIIRRCQIATRSVKDVNTLQEDYEDRPIFVKELTRVNKGAEDNVLNFVPPLKSVKLERTVEMFQWVENKVKQKDGGFSYSYERQWLSYDVDSSPFQEYYLHKNPKREPKLFSDVINAAPIYVGAYRLNSEQIDMLVDWKPCPVYALPADLPTELLQLAPLAEDGYLVFRGCLSDPSIGTVRIRYRTIAEGGKISTIGVQRGQSFRPFYESDAHIVVPRILTQPNSITASAVNTASSTSDYQQQLNIECSSNGEINNCRGSSSSSIDITQDSHDKQSGLVEEGVFSDENNDNISKVNGCWDCCQCCVCCFFCMCCQPCFGLVTYLASWSVGTSILLLEETWDTNINRMFQHAWNRFRMRAWTIRIVSYLLLGWGWYLVLFSPVVAILTFIPYIGWMAANILWLAAMLLGFLEGILISSLATVFYRPLILTVYLLAAGLMMWLSPFILHSTHHDSSYHSNSILCGQILCLISILPLSYYIYQWIEECRFISLQYKLDRNHNNSSSGGSMNSSSNSARLNRDSYEKNNYIVDERTPLIEMA